MHELHGDIDILCFARGRLWMAEPYAAPVTEADLEQRMRTRSVRMKTRTSLTNWRRSAR